MKSKKWVSLALAVALSASALGVYAAAPDAGVTAYASVKYSDGSVPANDLPDITAEVTFTKAELEKMWNNSSGDAQKLLKLNTEGMAKYPDAKANGQAGYVWTQKWETKGTQKYAGLIDESTTPMDASYSGVYRVSFATTGIKADKYKSGGVYTFYGWKQGEDGSANKDDAIDPDGKFNVILKADMANVFYTVVKKATDDEEIANNLKAIAEKEAASKAADKRTNHCWGRAWRHSAGNSFKNVTNGVVDNIYLKGKLQKGSGSYSKEKISSIIKAVGADEEKEIVWVYDVSVPDTHELIDRKNAMVRLYVDTGYTTNGYIPTVFHVTEQGVTKVNDLDVGTYDVMFFARDFSPYVLILSPGKVDKYENPPTGDFDAVPMALFAAASLSATGAMLMRRKRELGE